VISMPWNGLVLNPDIGGEFTGSGASGKAGGGSRVAPTS
jgi:hypothetical protein